MRWRSITRRVLLGAGAAALSLRSYASAQTDYYSPDFLEELFDSNSEDIAPPPNPSRLTSESYAEIVELLKTGSVRARWPEQARAPDYAHLDEVQAPDTLFAFNATALRQLLAANGFAPTATTGHILFGLRGCRVADASGAASGARVDLVEDMPDHWTHRCVLGVLNLESDELSVFSGSTVPDAAYVYAQFVGQEGANMMPTGRYGYTVGTHVWRKPRARQPGAWRQRRAWPVRRVLSPDESQALSYTHDAVWDTPSSVCATRAPTGNNIHAGVLDGWDGGVKFSSAGCQVVSGRYSPRGQTPDGLWRQFRVAAGLPADPVLEPIIGPDGVTPTVRTPEDGRAYTYVLLTGTEARLAATGRASPRLRYGSRGAKVAELQAALAREVNGCIGIDNSMGMQSIAALVRYQRENGMRTDGIVTPAVAELLGVSL